MLDDFLFHVWLLFYKIFFLSNLYIFLFILLGSFLGEGILFCLILKVLFLLLDGSYTALRNAEVFLRGLFLAWTVITCNCCPNDPSRKLYKRWLSFSGSAITNTSTIFSMARIKEFDLAVCKKHAIWLRKNKTQLECHFFKNNKCKWKWPIIFEGSKEDYKEM